MNIQTIFRRAAAPSSAVVFLGLASFVGTLRNPPVLRSASAQGASAQTASNNDEYRQGLARARAVALPPAQRPRQFVIASYLIGPGAAASPAAQAQALDDGVQTLAMLGINTLELKGFGDAGARVAETSRAQGITRFRRAIYAPVRSRDGLPALYFNWNTEETNPQRVAQWADQQISETRALGFAPSDVALFHMADEPAWYYPDIVQKFSSTPQRLEMFRAFLRSKSLQPRDVGASAWNEVVPITPSQLRAGQNTLAQRRLFYWTTRYPVESASAGFALWTQALKERFGADLLVTSNWNNWVNRTYLPSPGRKIGKNDDAGADAAMGFPDWMDMARKGGVSALWSEDWFRDQDAQNWSLYADALQSAALEGAAAGKKMEFGGYIVGRRLGDLPNGGSLKALSLIGHGAKALEWYVYGPASKFPSNAWSDNAAAYASIANANRLIARAEPLLYPGRRDAARIAILLPGSSQAWDETSTMSLQQMYQREFYGLHFALTHAQYPVDFVDETAIARGVLSERNYVNLYLTAPNLAASAQTKVRDWIAGGGTAIFSPGAAGADEYNSPSNVLDEARGVRNAIAPRKTLNDDTKVRTEVSFDDARFGENIAVMRGTIPLQVAGGSVMARFARGGAAVVFNRLGQGAAISYGFWPGASYFDSANRSDVSRLPQGWSNQLRAIATAPSRVTRVVRPVELNREVVEAARLDSPSGIAVTLLNWTGAPLGDVRVTIKRAGAIRSVGSAQRGTLPFERNGENIVVTMPLAEADVLMLRP